ncbi:hypothetical protein NDU88_003852 [Pleurodeles waltl]|uniref:Uncharacterized protein n=1 Tax=Pleurodeles waltl TaxID=8319 RepID=A0AAV7KWS0_PLEWA|nr:hypothetical protein NDU88_003852 [Pleurodeles waltl]
MASAPPFLIRQRQINHLFPQPTCCLVSAAPLLRHKVKEPSLPGTQDRPGSEVLPAVRTSAPERRQPRSASARRPKHFSPAHRWGDKRVAALFRSQRDRGPCSPVCPFLLMQVSPWVHLRGAATGFSSAAPGPRQAPRMRSKAARSQPQQRFFIPMSARQLFFLGWAASEVMGLLPLAFFSQRPPCPDNWRINSFALWSLTELCPSCGPIRPRPWPVQIVTDNTTAM